MTFTCGGERCEPAGERAWRPYGGRVQLQILQLIPSSGRDEVAASNEEHDM